MFHASNFFRLKNLDPFITVLMQDAEGQGANNSGCIK